MNESLLNSNFFGADKKKIVMRLIVFCSLLFPLMVAAQPVSVSAFTDKSKILLGEPLWLTLEVKTLNGQKPTAFKVDSIPHFEFLIKDSSNVLQQGDTTIYRQYFQLTSFDSGRWVIPQFTFRPFVKTNTVLVDVAFTEDFDASKPYNDVKEIKEVPFKLNADIERWWYRIAAFLIFITVLIYWATDKQKPKQKKRLLSPESAYKKAMEHLQKLKQHTLNETSFYAQLIEIFRTYIEERTGISSMQQTSNELILKIQPLMSDDKKYQQLAQVLALCDLVKFAKYNPDNNEADAAFSVVRDAINYIEQEVKTGNARHKS